MSSDTKKEQWGQVLPSQSIIIKFTIGFLLVALVAIHSLPRHIISLWDESGESCIVPSAFIRQNTSVMIISLIVVK